MGNDRIKRAEAQLCDAIVAALRQDRTTVSKAHLSDVEASSRELCAALAEPLLEDLEALKVKLETIDRNVSRGRRPAEQADKLR